MVLKADAPIGVAGEHLWEVAAAHAQTSLATRNHSGRRFYFLILWGSLEILAGRPGFEPG
jgi:hypothetical protein